MVTAKELRARLAPYVVHRVPHPRPALVAHRGVLIWALRRFYLRDRTRRAS